MHILNIYLLIIVINLITNFKDKVNKNIMILFYHYITYIYINYNYYNLLVK